MSFGSPWALALLAGLPVLLWLALHRPKPRQLSVGTLLLWRRVAAEFAPSRRRRMPDLLFWLAAGALLLSALAAAGPSLDRSAGAPRVDVYVEMLSPAGRDEDGLSLLRRAREAAPGAEFRFFAAGEIEGLPETVRLHPGTVERELAQFAARAESPARLCLLSASQEVEGMLVLPRVEQARSGAVFELRVEDETVFARAFGPEPPKVAGLSLRGAWTEQGDFVREYALKGGAAEIAPAEGPALTISPRPSLRVYADEGWQGPAHGALMEAAGLQAENVPDHAEIRLGAGGSADLPELRVGCGQPMDTDGLVLSWDPLHPLLADLPLADFPWLEAGLGMPPNADERPLLAALRDGEPVANLVSISRDDRVLRFASDPFAEAPAASAALLFDNALGVLVGERPSARAAWRLDNPKALSSARAARAAPFSPVGELEPATGVDRPASLALWLALGAAILASACGALAMRRRFVVLV